MILKNRFKKNSLMEIALPFDTVLKSCPAIKNPLSTKNKSTPVQPKLLTRPASHAGCPKNW